MNNTILKTAFLKIFVLIVLCFMACPNQALCQITNTEQALDDIKNKFLDSEGFVVQGDRNGGDTLNRLGHLYSLLFLLGYEKDLQGRPLKEGFQEQLKKLTVTPGLYRRHWAKKTSQCVDKEGVAKNYYNEDCVVNTSGVLCGSQQGGEPKTDCFISPLKDSWWYNEKTTSRDQYTPIVIAASLLGDKQIIKDITGYLKLEQQPNKHNLEYPNRLQSDLNPNNPDIVQPGSAVDLLRGGADITGLLLYDRYKNDWAALDCGLLYMARYRSLVTVGPKPLDGGSDDLNTTLSILHGLTKNPTENLRAAAYTYFNASQSPIDRLRHYFRPQSSAPPLDVLYAAAIAKVLGASPLPQVSGSPSCGKQISDMLSFFANREFKKANVCSKVSATVKAGLRRTTSARIKTLNFDFPGPKAKLFIEPEVICKNPPTGIEMAFKERILIDIDPSTCSSDVIINLFLGGTARVDQKFTKDQKKDVQKNIREWLSQTISHCSVGTGGP